ncbi:folate-binding protein YgfZ [Halopseudomonas sp.]|uniref:CAF17-like 4Fe-4S cluster assembly/insertion protein YgfZ n=1 Tax=Halopseudomonas sp. TaxID=2901191 RepID=UPI003562B7A1
MTHNNPLYIRLSERFTVDPSLHAAAVALSWLGHEGILAVNGPDSARFLQGQVTCDVARLSVPESILGARCNPKGRMQSSFRLLRHGESDYLLAMAEELVAPQIADLAKYAAFFKTEISDANGQWVRLGLSGPGATETLARTGLGTPEATNSVSQSESGMVVRLVDSDIFELWLPAGSAEATIDALLQTAQPAPLNYWQMLQIRNGIGQVFGETREHFIPQMLNLQVFDAVSFKKGCYTGQEIVARMKYLGKLKKRMFRLTSDERRLLPPGTAVVNRETGQALGEVVMTALGHEQMEMLAVVQKDAAQLVSLSAIDDQGPALTLADLPYEKEVADTEAGPAN